MGNRGAENGPIRLATLALVILVAAAIGCSRGEPQLPDGHNAVPARLVLAGASLARPRGIAVVGSTVVIGDIAEPYLKFIDSRTGELLATKGGKGRGPGEFESVRSIQHYTSEARGSSVWAFDSRQQRLLGYAIDSNGGIRRIERQVLPKVPGNTMYLQWLSDSLLIAAGHLEGGRFWVVDPTGRALVPLGQVPLVSDEVSAFAAQQALQPSLALRPGGRYAAVGSRYAGRVDVYDLRENRMEEARVPIPFEPDLQIAMHGDMPVFRTDGNTRFGYVSVAATNDEIFGLFSGRTRASHPGRAHYGTQVHVFDWTGRFLRSVDLGRDVFEIGVSSDGASLYAISHHPEPALYEYHL